MDGALSAELYKCQYYAICVGVLFERQARRKADCQARYQAKCKADWPDGRQAKERPVLRLGAGGYR